MSEAFELTPPPELPEPMFPMPVEQGDGEHADEYDVPAMLATIDQQAATIAIQRANLRQLQESVEVTRNALRQVDEERRDRGERLARMAEALRNIAAI